jgi:hypothetical protein
VLDRGFLGSLFWKIIKWTRLVFFANEQQQNFVSVDGHNFRSSSPMRRLLFVFLFPRKIARGTPRFAAGTSIGWQRSGIRDDDKTAKNNQQNNK